MKKRFIYFAAALMSSLVFAQENEGLEKKIQNPIASLISVPFQNNTDFGIGPDNLTRNTLNIQPVLPFSLTKDINLIVRTIVPVISQPLSPDTSEFGIGDINTSLFLTAAKPKKVITGYGLVVGLPTATNSALGAGKWTVGPSFLAMIQPESWTIGGLVQNTWSTSGPEVNFFYSQIFAVKNLNKGWYLNSAPIITANWNASKGNEWTVPLGIGAGRLFRVGKLPINGQIGYYQNVVKPENGADSQFRFQLVLLFPK